jgi:DNA-binding NtrC family response regulator
VRELKNAIERAMILEDDSFLGPTYLPFHVTQPRAGVTTFERQSSATPVGGSWQPIQPGRQFPGTGAAADERGLPKLRDGRWLPPLSIPEGGTSLEEVERALVELALKQTNGNQTHAAKLLDISRDALRYKMKKFGLITSAEEPAQEAPAPPHS